MRRGHRSVLKRNKSRARRKRGQRHCHVWTYMDPARLQPFLANSDPRVTTADVYPASLCGLISHRREPRWIFARFHLNVAYFRPRTGPSGGLSFRACPP